MAKRKKIISSTPSGLKIHCASLTPGFTGGHNCLDPMDLYAKPTTFLSHGDGGVCVFRLEFNRVTKGIEEATLG